MISFFTKNFPNVVALGWGGDAGWGTAIFQTLFMTFWSAIFGGILGLIFGLLLVLTKPKGILANKVVYFVSLCCSCYSEDCRYSNWNESSFSATNLRNFSIFCTPSSSCS